MDFYKTLATVALASSVGVVSAQEIHIPTRTDGLGLKVSGSVWQAMDQPKIDLSIPRGYRVGGDEIGTMVEGLVDPMKENLTWLDKKYHDPCRDLKKTLAQNAQCQISRGGFTDTTAGRDMRDWQMRKSQVDFTNSLAKKLLGDTVSLTEGTLTQPSKIVWFQHWKPGLKIDTTAGRLRSNFEVGYYRTF